MVIAISIELISLIELSMAGYSYNCEKTLGYPCEMNPSIEGTLVSLLFLMLAISLLKIGYDIFRETRYAGEGS